ncbi:hypothetical protein SAMN04488515_1564 [Cognatiyoonia koreensis]|uniref:HTH cro/C1-type domain-containing protein n=1 Tax=Cognatiyoonia koreensis TaxID=364200 RepID=A0A1I0PZY5_9RHOB|nr:XRE family transcriptional regulator [Cognatiyoonia koreensis]SEW20170.1 hypothetical protein SAMN04488515_1564 [Cognatiyoonia koreensis]
MILLQAQKAFEKVQELTTSGDTHAGTRIRERRLDLGLRQAELAKKLGISPSYLNLIEHNRRRIAGTLLSDVGRALDVDPSLLTQGASRAVLDQLHAAAAGAKLPAEIERTEELAARYPGWAALIAAQHGRIGILEARIAELTDRLTHDPQLATSMHAVISAVTSIRSTASILTSGERLDADWISRFHKNINDDAVRLAESSDALVRYLDAPPDQDTPLSPRDEVTQYLSQLDFHLPALERPNGSPEKEARSAGLSPLAEAVLQSEMERYQRLAHAMPLSNITNAIADLGVHPDRIAAQFNVSFQDVLERLACLPQSSNLPKSGFVTCDGAGAIMLQKSVDGFSLAQGGVACPLWPVFTAISQPGRPICATVALPGQQGDRFLCYAVATQSGGGLNMPPVIRSTMLLLPTQDAPELKVGPACRICPRNDCKARREPSALRGDA